MDPQASSVEYTSKESHERIVRLLRRNFSRKTEDQLSTDEIAVRSSSVVACRSTALLQSLVLEMTSYFSAFVSRIVSVPAQVLRRLRADLAPDQWSHYTKLARSSMRQPPKRLSAGGATTKQWQKLAIRQGAHNPTPLQRELVATQPVLSRITDQNRDPEELILVTPQSWGELQQIQRTPSPTDPDLRTRIDPPYTPAVLGRSILAQQNERVSSPERLRQPREVFQPSRINQFHISMGIPAPSRSLHSPKQVQRPWQTTLSRQRARITSAGIHRTQLHELAADLVEDQGSTHRRKESYAACDSAIMVPCSDVIDGGESSQDGDRPSFGTEILDPWFYQAEVPHLDVNHGDLSKHQSCAHVHVQLAEQDEMQATKADMVPSIIDSDALSSNENTGLDIGHEYETSTEAEIVALQRICDVARSLGGYDGHTTIVRKRYFSSSPRPPAQSRSYLDSSSAFAAVHYLADSAVEAARQCGAAHTKSTLFGSVHTHAEDGEAGNSLHVLPRVERSRHAPSERRTVNSKSQPQDTSRELNAITSMQSDLRDIKLSFLRISLDFHRSWCMLHISVARSECWQAFVRVIRPCVGGQGQAPSFVIGRNTTPTVGTPTRASAIDAAFRVYVDRMGFERAHIVCPGTIGDKWVLPAIEAVVSQCSDPHITALLVTSTSIHDLLAVESGCSDTGAGYKAPQVGLQSPASCTRVCIDATSCNEILPILRGRAEMHSDGWILLRALCGSACAGPSPNRTLSVWFPTRHSSDDRSGWIAEMEIRLARSLISQQHDISTAEIATTHALHVDRLGVSSTVALVCIETQRNTDETQSTHADLWISLEHAADNAQNQKWSRAEASEIGPASMGNQSGSDGEISKSALNVIPKLRSRTTRVRRGHGMAAGGGVQEQRRERTCQAQQQHPSFDTLQHLGFQ